MTTTRIVFIGKQGCGKSRLARALYEGGFQGQVLTGVTGLDLVLEPRPGETAPEGPTCRMHIRHDDLVIWVRDMAL